MQADEFGLPPLEKAREALAKVQAENAAMPTMTIETPEQRIERLRAQAVQIASQQSDAEMLAAFVEEEKAKRREALLPTDVSGWPADYDRIEIYEGTDPNELQYVPLGLGGYTIRVPRGEEVIIPHVYVTECLEHAVITTCTQGKDGLILRDRRRFPHRFIGKATPDEYQAYIHGQRSKAATQLAAAQAAGS